MQFREYCKPDESIDNSKDLDKNPHCCCQDRAIGCRQQQILKAAKTLVQKKSLADRGYFA